MSGRLVCGSVDLNDRAVVTAILRGAMIALRSESSWHVLDVHLGSYFRTPGFEPPTAPGWYIIVDLARNPLCVGESEDLAFRLNSSNGSLDSFLDSTRKSDSVRNFIKYLVSAGIIDGLRVGIIEEPVILQQLGIDSELSRLDRCNVEKLLGIFRAGLAPKSAPVAG